MSMTDTLALSTSSHGGLRQEIWDGETTEAFINLIKDKYPRLTGKTVTRATAWREILAIMSALVSLNCGLFIEMLLNAAYIFMISNEHSV